jgi:hypothetical protein
MRALRIVLAAVFATPLAVVASCSVGELDLTGKQCPCAGGYVCDVPRDTCVLAESLEGGVSIDAPGDAMAAPDRDPAAKIAVSGLRAVWTTPAMVRWEWTVEGTATDFQAYEVATATTADDLAKRAGTFEVISGNDRPEVKAFDARGGKKAGPVVVWTALGVRGPGTRQFLQVKATDVTGRSTSTAAVDVTSSPAPPSTKIIFDGTAAKTSKPAEFQYRTPAGGPNVYVLNVACGTAASPCVKRAELTSLGLDLGDATTFTAKDFDAAFLQVQLEGNVGVTSFDSTFALELGAGACVPDCHYAFAGWTQSSTGPTTLQVPLRVMKNAKGELLTHAAIAARGFQIFGLVFEGTWRQDAVLRVLDARVRF